MKRQKAKPQVHSKKTEIKKKEQTIVQTIFDKYLAPYHFWVYLAFTLMIAFLAFGKFFRTEYLFFFKDIGSDSLNQDYPSIMHTLNLAKESFFQKYSFFTGMGDSFYTQFPNEPVGLFRTLLNYISINYMGENYLVTSRFINTFIFSILLSGIVFYFYLRTISINKFNSLIGALLFTFSGYMVVASSWGFAGHLFRASTLLFAFEQLYLKKRWYFFPFAIIYASGNFFMLYLYSLFLLIYSLFRFFAENRENISGYLKLLGQMIILGIVGLLMNADRLINGIMSMVNSPRVSGNASLAQTLSQGQDIVDQSALWPTTLLRFFSSDILGTGSNFKGWFNYFEAPLFYIGLLSLIVFPQIFIYLNKRNKIIFGSFFGFWILTLVFPFLRYAILAFTGDYFRFGFDFFIPFVLLLFSLYALNELDKSLKINYLVLGSTVFVLLVLLFFPYTSIPLRAVDNQLRSLIVIIIILYSGILILLTNPQYKSLAQLALLIVLTFELSYFSYKSYEKRVAVSKKEFLRNKGGYNDGTIQAVNYIKSIDPSPFYRTEKDYQSGKAMHSSLNDAMAQGYYGTSNYSSFNQLNYIRFLEETDLIKKGDETGTRWATGFKGQPLLQTFGSVKYHLSKSANPFFKNFGFDSIAATDSVKILKNRYFLPFGFCYKKYIEYNDFKNLGRFEKQLALLNGFVIEEENGSVINRDQFVKLQSSDSSVFVSETKFNFQLYKTFTDSLKKDSLQITSFKQDNIQGTIKLDKNKMLFFTIPFDEGWRVKVNKKQSELVKVNIGFTGIVLPAGNHHIELYYVPKYSVLTSSVSIISIILFWAYLGYYLYSKRNKKAL